jgi:alanyl-tRNA synthetase
VSVTFRQEVPPGYVRIIPAQVVFTMHDRYGITFDLTFEMMKERRWICDAVELFRLCVDHKWNKEQTWKKIQHAFRDSYGTEEEIKGWLVGKEIA